MNSSVNGTMDDNSNTNVNCNANINSNITINNNNRSVNNDRINNSDSSNNNINDTVNINNCTNSLSINRAKITAITIIPAFTNGKQIRYNIETIAQIVQQHEYNILVYIDQTYIFGWNKVVK